MTEGRRVAASLAISLAIAGCASTDRFAAPPERMLGAIEIRVRTEADRSLVGIRNRSLTFAQYLAPLFFRSRTEDEIENEYPWNTHFVEEKDGWMMFHERALAPRQHVVLDWQGPICDDPAERVGVFFKLEREGKTTYRVLWSLPIGDAPTSS